MASTEAMLETKRSDGFLVTGDVKAGRVRAAAARTRPLAAPTLKVQSGRNGAAESTEQAVCWVLLQPVSKVVTITTALVNVGVRRKRGAECLEW